MGYQPFPIVNMRQGQRQDVASFLLPDDSNPQLINATDFRGRTVEKGGDTLLAQDKTQSFRGRLGVRTFSGTTDGSGRIVAGTVFNSSALDPKTIIITCGLLTAIDNGSGTFTDYSSSGWAGTGTITYSTGTVATNITGFANSTAYTVYMILQPNSDSPVMGLGTRTLDSISINQLIAFDCKKPYVFSNVADRFELIDSYNSSAADDPVLTFKGADSDFFYSSNYANAFWTTNNIHGLQGKQNISAISLGATTTITFSTNHSFTVNDQVFLYGIRGTTQLNGQSATITATPGANQITININSTTYSAFSAGGHPSVFVINRDVGDGDGIKWYTNEGWHNFCPPLNDVTASNEPSYLQGALFVLPFKGYQIALNTFEGPTYSLAANYQQRLRYSQNGTPFYAGPVPDNQTADYTSWLERPGKGGYIDAPTSEKIVGCEYIRDTITVFFEASVWRIEFTENAYIPFIWTKVNNDYGSTSPFSTVSFDKTNLTVGDKGIIETDAVNVQRIDEKIPDFVYTIPTSNDGNLRIHGVRNFVSQIVRWNYCDVATNQSVVFPNSELIFNYKDQSWSIMRSYRTCYGQYQSWYDQTWQVSNFTWGSAQQSWRGPDQVQGSAILVGGNAQGFVHKLENQQLSQQSYNDRSFRVTSVNGSGQLVIPNHSFGDGTYVRLSGMSGANATYNDQIFSLRRISSSAVSAYDSSGALVSFTAQTLALGFVEVIDVMSIYTKKFYPGLNSGQQVRLGYIDLFFDGAQSNIEMELDIYIDDSSTPAQTKRFNIKRPDGSPNTKIMRRIFFEATGQGFQLRFTYPADQIFSFGSGSKQFVLHGMTMYTKPAGRMMREPLI